MEKGFWLGSVRTIRLLTFRPNPPGVSGRLGRQALVYGDPVRSGGGDLGENGVESQ